MKLALGIIIALLIALGVWLSFNLGSIEPRQDSSQVETTPTVSMLYADPEGRFAIRHPREYTAEPYTYQAIPERGIEGVRFIIPPSLAEGTNLSSDTFISVEHIPGAVNSCSAEIYLNNPQYQGYVDAGNRRYSIATSMGAAAGSRYEETVYATPVDGGCIGVRYFVHYGAIGNYPAGSVREFDRQALLTEFDAIRTTLEIR